MNIEQIGRQNVQNSRFYGGDGGNYFAPPIGSMPLT